MIRYEFEKGPDYIHFEINPFDVAEYYGRKVRDAYERDIRSWLNNVKEWGRLDNYLLNAIPQGHTVYWWVLGSEHYVAVFADGEGSIYKIEEPYGYDDVIMSLTRIYFVGCGVSVEIVNTQYDYYELILQDGTILTSQDPEYEEVLRKIIECERYSTSAML